MRFDPHKLDEIRARLPVSAVVGRRVSLKKKGREFAGLSPFKTEKTPSFFVNDQKGFYHCFASGEHGDIFTFLMKMEGLSFPEAVERLADEAGVALPKPDPRERDRAEQRLRLHEVHQVAVRFFIEQLRGPAGAEARDYLVRRGLADETIRTFGIGYAPNGRTDLLNLLKSQGFSEAEINTSGLVISGADIAKPYDRFRDRVMFPILDLRERVIAFGGRALSSDQPAKYLNSPETPIFHKGHVLFNAARARQRAHKTGAMVVVEGYMDVVALAEAGITNAVAPLGTALTTDQIAQLWRFVDEPLLCFDGDSAGRKAAFRAIDTALPGLQPGKSLRFAFLPDGLDPDDFVRERGVEQLRDLFGAAQSFSDTLWDREWGDGNWATP
ncbi:MAG: DNA primase, partial [Pseudomonadota bacterium]